MLLVARSGVLPALLGVIVGAALSVGALRVMRSVIYGVGVYDAATMVGTALTLLLVALFAAAGPTLRIAKIDPARTLREE